MITLKVNGKEYQNGFSGAVHGVRVGNGVLLSWLKEPKFQARSLEVMLRGAVRSHLSWGCTRV